MVGFFMDRKVDTIVCGADSSYARVHSTSEGGLPMLYSWGWGWEGRLGHPEHGDMPLPRPITALAALHVRKIACGDAHVLAIANEGDLYAFGRNTSG